MGGRARGAGAFPHPAARTPITPQAKAMLFARLARVKAAAHGLKPGASRRPTRCTMRNLRARAITLMSGEAWRRGNIAPPAPSALPAQSGQSSMPGVDGGVWKSGSNVDEVLKNAEQADGANDQPERKRRAGGGDGSARSASASERIAPGYLITASSTVFTMPSSSSHPRMV